MKPGQDGLIAVDEVVDLLPDLLLQLQVLRNAFLDVERILVDGSKSFSGRVPAFKPKVRGFNS